MEAHIFEQQHAAVAERLALRFRFGADAIRREFDGLAEQFLQPRGNRREAVLRIHFALGPAQMRREHQPRAALHGKLEAWATFRGCACRR